jgi:hypothetical protein
MSFVNLSLFQNLFILVPNYYCELRQAGNIARPGYAISDIVMLAVGVFIWYRFGRRWSGRLVGLAMIFMSIFSFLYDLHQNRLTRLLDHLGIFNMFMIFIILSLGLILPRIKLWLTAFLGITFVYVVSFVNIFFDGGLLQPVFTVLVIMLLLVEFEVFQRLGSTYERKDWLAAIALLFLGLAAQMTDSTNSWCASSGWEVLNGRAIYHYLAAIAIYLMLRHFQRNQSTRV